jgi:nicotinamide mononucleotide transporter
LQLTDQAARLLEPAAFAFALGYVVLSIRQRALAWPLMVASSALYGVLFLAGRLYGQTLLQGVFIVIALWGWWQWTHGRKGDRRLEVTPLGVRQRLLLFAVWFGATVPAAFALGRLTDAASPWLDGFTTIGSLLAQLLTARKYTEAWPAWLVINLISVALFLQQKLLLTAALYALMAALSLAGWWTWHRNARAAATTQATA